MNPDDFDWHGDDVSDGDREAALLWAIADAFDMGLADPRLPMLAAVVRSIAEHDDPAYVLARLRSGRIATAPSSVPGGVDLTLYGKRAHPVWFSDDFTDQSDDVRIPLGTLPAGGRWPFAAEG